MSGTDVATYTREGIIKQLEEASPSRLFNLCVRT
jgi:hypothetical protein